VGGRGEQAFHPDSFIDLPGKAFKFQAVHFPADILPQSALFSGFLGGAHGNG